MRTPHARVRVAVVWRCVAYVSYARVRVRVYDVSRGVGCRELERDECVCVCARKTDMR